MAPVKGDYTFPRHRNPVETRSDRSENKMKEKLPKNFHVYKKGQKRIIPFEFSTQYLNVSKVEEIGYAVIRPIYKFHEFDGVHICTEYETLTYSVDIYSVPAFLKTVYKIMNDQDLYLSLAKYTDDPTISGFLHQGHNKREIFKFNSQSNNQDNGEPEKHEDVDLTNRL